MFLITVHLANPKLSPEKKVIHEQQKTMLINLFKKLDKEKTIIVGDFNIPYDKCCKLQNTKKTLKYYRINKSWYVYINKFKL